MMLKGHYALCFKTRASFGAHHEYLNEDRPIVSATKPSDSTFWQCKIYADSRMVFEIYVNFEFSLGFLRYACARMYRYGIPYSISSSRRWFITLSYQ